MTAPQMFKNFKLPFKNSFLFIVLVFCTELLLGQTDPLYIDAAGNVYIKVKNRNKLSVEGNATFSDTVSVSVLKAGNKLSVIGNTDISGVLKANAVKDTTGYVTPKGGIIMYGGSIDNFDNGVGKPGTPVEGWVLCDGRNNTPNLTERFIMGAGGNTSPNTVGGNKDITLSADQIPPHYHELQGISVQGTPEAGDGWSHLRANGDNWNTTTTSENVGSGNASASVNITPPYYALFYIMKL